MVRNVCTEMLSLLLALSVRQELVNSLPTGAPCSRIDSITPNHIGGLWTKPPYRLIPSATCYTPGVALNVRLVARGAGVSFRGFALQAHRHCAPLGASGAGLRTGLMLLDEQRLLDVANVKYQCDGDLTSVTHTWRDNKTRIGVEWVAQDDTAGAVQFVATVVQDYSTYWVQAVKSPAIPPCGRTVPECDRSEEENDVTERSGRATLKGDGAETAKETDVCSEPYKAGDYCGAGFVRRYYHVAGHCQSFWYGGCNGTSNNFQSHQQCQERCVKQKAAPKPKWTSKCDQEPGEQGYWCGGRKSGRRWTFTGRGCTQFNYMGCGGSSNRFDTRAQCQAACIDEECSQYGDGDDNCARWASTGLCHRNRDTLAKCALSCCRALERLTVPAGSDGSGGR